MQSIPVGEIERREARLRIVLYAKRAWIVVAKITPDGKLRIDSGDSGAEWAISIEPLELPRLCTLLQEQTSLVAGQQGWEERLLLMLFQVFGGRYSNPWEDIKAFLQRNCVRSTADFWSSWS